MISAEGDARVNEMLEKYFHDKQSFFLLESANVRFFSLRLEERLMISL